MPSAAVPGAPPPNSSSPQQTRPIGAPSLKGPSPELRAAYDEAFKLSMQNPSDPPTPRQVRRACHPGRRHRRRDSALERLLLIDGEQADVKLELASSIPVGLDRGGAHVSRGGAHVQAGIRPRSRKGRRLS